MSRYRYKSDITRQLRPSLEELKSHGYLKRWKIAKAGQGGYKIVFWHGSRFRNARRKRLPGEESQKKTPASPNSPGSAELAELTARGIPEDRAKDILANLAPDQGVLDQLEYADQVIAKGGIENPVGFTIALLKKNQPLPPDFVSSRQRRLDEEEQRVAEELAPTTARSLPTIPSTSVRRHVGENDLQAEYETRLAGKVERLRRIMKKPDEELLPFAKSSLRDEYAREIPGSALGGGILAPPRRRYISRCIPRHVPPERANAL